MRIFRPVLIAVLLLASCLPCLAAGITAQGRDFFEAKIRPVLIAECYECHAGTAKKGGLLLDSRPALLAGGGSGAAVAPGDPDNSLLIRTLRHEHADTDLHMPKNGAKLEDGIIADFVEWVKMGAPDPRDTAEVVTVGEGTWEQAFALRKRWWSFQPVKAAKPASHGGAHPVDAFVREKLREAGLQPAEQADRRTLLRRLSYVLTGLPPGREEMEAFLRDDSPDAWERAVDRYLAAPAFGETWARHWMDLMRYAETHGSEGDPAIPQAWRYRDHLIRAFNDDVPYDQMVREHVAGDLLENPRCNAELGINESLLATANLRLVEHGFQPVDSLDEQVKMVDNQIDVLTKSFLGLTVSCARCHDHKFDAISQKDYFALYGIFASTRPGQVTLDTPEIQALHRAELAGLKGRIKSRLAELWLREAEDLPRLIGGGDAPRRELEQQLARLRDSARRAVLRARGMDAGTRAPQPMAQWSFEEDGRDGAGALHAELLGGARIRNGRLVLDGNEAYARTAALGDEVAEKTLEVWVALANTDQRGGGVMTLETQNGAVFDAVVFGEKAPREWISGSNHHRRTQLVGGLLEASPADALVHLAIAYSRENTVTIYRNGEPYGASYTSAEALPVFAGDEARILFGRRHTGGARAFFAGEIEEARLYGRALGAEEIAASYRQGVVRVTDEEMRAVMTEAQRGQERELMEKLQGLEPDSSSSGRGKAWRQALEEARKEARSPLRPWVLLQGGGGEAFAQKWAGMAARWREDGERRRRFNREHFVRLWDLQGGDYVKWTRMGNGLPAQPVRPGEFVVGLSGARVVERILPAGIYSHLLSTKHNALLASPYFLMDADAVSLRLAGGGGAGLRVMVDNYPLGNNDTYPQYRPDGRPMRWVRLDTTYRKGARAYVELATQDDLTRQLRDDNAADGEGAAKGRSWFGVADIVLHKDAEEAPLEEVFPVDVLFEGKAPQDAAALAAGMRDRLAESIRAWNHDAMSAGQQALLDYFVGKGLLAVLLEELPEEVRGLVRLYRELEAEVPAPTRAPGPVEGDGYDARLMVRGNHQQQGEVVPRRFLQALGGDGLFGRQVAGSGRLQLALAMTDGGSNPLLARVMANRIWHWLFGRGLVGTVDNFGRLGDKPTHPELLDWLAGRFAEDGYSMKKMIRLLLTSQTWRQSHLASEQAERSDPANRYWSHMPVRRLEAEMIRDAMLQVSGALDVTMFGAPVADSAFRRSLYLSERRNSPQPFLEVFDRPKPATTRGQRDATNIPAQSLTMMNSPFVIQLAGRWAKALLADGAGTDALGRRLEVVYQAALGRPPADDEIAAAAAYLGPEPGLEAWRDYLQAVFALKEFIYLR